MDKQSQEFLQYCPFFCYETFLCASFLLLKIIKNNYFSSIIDADAGKKLVNFSVAAMRRLSVANNDLPGRLSDVLAYLWTHPNPTVIGDSGADGLQLKVRSRMSMSIVYDSLWRWREQFKAEEDSSGVPGLVQGEGDPSRSKIFCLHYTDPQLSVNGSELFDITFDLSDLNVMYTEDLSFDWFA